MIRVYLTLGLCAALIAAGLWLDHRGYERGKTDCQAERAESVQKVQAAIDLRDTATAQTRVDMLDMLRVTIPPIEVRTHDTITKIRTVYRDRPVDPGACARPDGVQTALDEARERANAAASGVRRAAPWPDTANPRAGPNG